MFRGAVLKKKVRTAANEQASGVRKCPDFASSSGNHQGIYIPARLKSTPLVGDTGYTGNNQGVDIP